MPDEEEEAFLSQWAPLVAAQARRLSRVAQASGFTVEDLETIGRLALLEGRAAYDPEKGSLTGWLVNSVKWAILRALRQAGPLVSGIPINAPERLKPVLLFGDLTPAEDAEGGEPLPFEETLCDPQAEAGFAAVEEKLHTEAMLARIPERLQEPVRMRLQGKTLEEIASAFGVTRGAVHLWIHQARRYCRKGLDK